MHVIIMLQISVKISENKLLEKLQEQTGIANILKMRSVCLLCEKNLLYIIMFMCTSDPFNKFDVILSSLFNKRSP